MSPYLDIVPTDVRAAQAESTTCWTPRQLQILRMKVSIMSTRAQAVVHRAVALATAALIAVVGVLLATASHASGRRSPNIRRDFSIFAHSRQHRHNAAHAAAAPSVTPPPGAVLATVSENVEIYAYQPTPQTLCVVNAKIGGNGGAACGLASQAAEEGIVSVHREGEGPTATVRTIALMPNAVTSLVFTDRDGATHTVSVTNNVAVLEDSDVASVAYSTPTGAARQFDLGAVVEHLANLTPRSTSTSAE